MAERNDITIVQDTSPRYAEIAAPSTEIVMQDYVDTLRILEDDFVNMGFPFLISASGKDDLGGGTLVAITVREQNLQLAFQQRTAPAETGTVTTASGPPNALGRIRFIDTNADFLTALVQPGSYIVNWVDRSVSDVIRVVSANELELRTPALGTDNEYDIGDDYTVWNVTQVRTSGGNLTAVDANGSTIPAILPTWGTQVILTTSSSATIQELEEIRFAAYNNGITLDPADPNAISGTDYPAGTQAVPSDNWADAIAIGEELGLHTVYLHDGTYTVPASTDLSEHWTIIGEGATITTLTIPASAITNDTRIQDVTLQNSFVDNGALIERTFLVDNSIDGGFYFECSFSGTTTLTGTEQVNIITCYSGVAGGGPSDTPKFVINNAIVVGRDYYGGVEFQSKTSTAGFSWDMSSGQVVVNDNNTTGDMTLRGNGKWTNKDTYAGTATVINELDNPDTVAAAVWNALVVTYTAAGSFGQQVGRKLLTVSKFLGLK